MSFGAPSGLDTTALAGALGQGATAAEIAPGRYRVEAPGQPGPAVAAAVTAHLAERGAGLTDLVVGPDARGRLLRRGRAEPRPLATTPSRPPGRRAGVGAGGGAVDEPASAAPATTDTNARRRALRPLFGQTGAEIYMTLRRGETLLLTIGIPVVFLVFFSKVSVISTPTANPTDFFVPGILALAVMSTSMVSLGIATGFERGYGVLKRLGATPLGRPRLLGAKIITIVAVELLQAAVLLTVGLALGWNPGGGARRCGRRRDRRHPPRLGRVRRHRPVHGGHAPGRGQPGRGQRPLPGPAAPRRHDRPASASSAAGWPTSPSCCRPRRSRPRCTPRSAAGASVPAESWVVLAVWAVAAPVAAALTFRWE